MTAEVKKLMEILNISEAEAQQVIADDKAIDRGERMDFDLSPAEEKNARKYAKVGKGEQKSKRNTARKPDEEKIFLIETLHNFLFENEEIGTKNVVIVNKNNEISFSLGENEYSIKLTKHRKAK